MGILRSDFNRSMFAVSDPFWCAFIKMRIAQEQVEREKAIKNSYNRNLQLQNQNDVEAMLLRILNITLNRNSVFGANMKSDSETEGLTLIKRS